MTEIKQKTPIKTVLLHLALPILVIVCVIGLDILVKELIKQFVPLNQGITVIPDFFYITNIKNTGAAFGSFAGATTVFLVVTGIAIPVVIVLMVLYHASHPLMLSSLALIVAGGLGNFIDRAAYGEVTDMFEFRFGGWTAPIFNVADIALTIGTILLIVYFLFVYYDKKDPKEVAKHERKQREKRERKEARRAAKDAEKVVSVADFLGAVESLPESPEEDVLSDESRETVDSPSESKDGKEA